MPDLSDLPSVLPMTSVEHNPVTFPPVSPATLALHHACSQGRIADVEDALRNGAEVNAPDRNGFTALHHLTTCAKRAPGVYKGIARCLIEAGADLNALSVLHDSPVLEAAGQDHWRLVDLLVEQGASVQPGVVGSCGHASLLSWAVTHGPLHSVQVLLDHGAPVNHTDNGGYTALAGLVWTMGPMRNRTTGDRLDRVMDLLLARGASVTGDLRSDPFVTPMALAVEHGADGALPRLLAAGAWTDDPRWQLPDHRLVLAHRAIDNARPYALGLLLDQGLGRAWPVAVWNDLAQRAHAVIARPSSGSHLTTQDERDQEHARRAQVLATVERVLLGHEAPPPGIAQPVTPARDRARL